jgi:hypothetical protein
MVSRALIRSLLFAAFLGPLAARAQVTVLGTEIAGLHQSNLAGEYDKIVGNVKDATVKVLPAARAFAEFAKCADCCISPANKNPVFYEFAGNAYVASKPMNLARIFIFSAPGKKAVSGLDALKGKKVGLRAGLAYGTRIDRAADFAKDFSPSAEASIKKLQLGRVDYLLEWTPDMDFAFQSLNMPPLPHAGQPVEVHEDSVVCKSSPRTTAFLEKLNGFIK